MPSVAYLPLSAGVYVWTDAGLRPAVHNPHQALVPISGKDIPQGQAYQPPLAFVQLPTVKQQVHSLSAPVDFGPSRMTAVPIGTHPSSLQLPVHCPPDSVFLWKSNRCPATSFQSFPTDPSTCISGSSPEGLHGRREVFDEPKGRYRPRSVRTRLLREWLCANRLHPYPCHENKLQLARDSEMTLDQVTTWFSNTRRRIRKVGMWTWSKGRYHDIRLREPAQEKRTTDVDESDDEGSDKDDKFSLSS